MSGSLWIALGLLVGVLWLEMVAPKRVLEGFQWTTFKDKKAQVPDGAKFGIQESLLTQPFSIRGDIGYTKEQAGFKSDKRYFADYADVQGIGANKDYCRMVFPEGGAEGDSFFACALAGTSGLPSTEYKTLKVKEGFKKGRDDYMRKIAADGRSAYCRIIKQGQLYQPMCLPAQDFSFATGDILDTNPPPDITTLVDFYRGCRMWLRFRDDMLDYVNTAILEVAGGAAVEEFPSRPVKTRGLQFNGHDQFLRLGDSRDLSFGNTGSFRSVRAFSVWVKFDKFTNNAHIFDFGNGAGIDNVFLGIVAGGDSFASGNEIRDGSKCADTTVPGPGSGAQFCPEMRSDELLKITSGNVDEFECPGAEVYANPMRTRPVSCCDQQGPVDASRATLIYEVWDSSLRKMQIKVNKAIGLNEWTHIVVTAATMDAMRPDIKIFVNGNVVYSQESGFLPQNEVTSKNYIGKSNWTDQPSEYELRDELFNGAIFDFRMYTKNLSDRGVSKIMEWGMGMLALT